MGSAIFYGATGAEGRFPLQARQKCLFPSLLGGTLPLFFLFCLRALGFP